MLKVEDSLNFCVCYVSNTTEMFQYLYLIFLFCLFMNAFLLKVCFVSIFWFVHAYESCYFVISRPARWREIIFCTMCVRACVRGSRTTTVTYFYPTALKGCLGIVFTSGVWMGGWEVGKSLSGLYLINRKV